MTRLTAFSTFGLVRLFTQSLVSETALSHCVRIKNGAVVSTLISHTRRCAFSFIIEGT